MSPVELQPPIATRVLETDGSDVVVRIYAPRPDTEPGGDWLCAYCVDGLAAGPAEGAAHGADAVQALVLALVVIGDRLAQQDQRLRFLGYTDPGFPVTDPPAQDPITHLTATLRQPLLPPDPE